ncbi:hypothetical protein AVEN_20054-1 [Araneus ventricosus]|uniref:Uncharacterized protein n=1 Tax=Araneus ventricosus TaxID=182803 RepID=A0A4Y2G7L6_ARAVE|nr:hypothetical protein AVEN_20054-1 [Araneus ventricosus]
MRIPTFPDLLLSERVPHFAHLSTPVALAVHMKRLDFKTSRMFKPSMAPCQSSSKFLTENRFWRGPLELPWRGALANMQPQISSSRPTETYKFNTDLQLS